MRSMVLSRGVLPSYSKSESTKSSADSTSSVWCMVEWLDLLRVREDQKPEARLEILVIGRVKIRER